MARTAAPHGPKRSELVLLRTTVQVKRALREAALRDGRSVSNLLELLAVEYCRARGLLPPAKS